MRAAFNNCTVDHSQVLLSAIQFSSATFTNCIFANIDSLGYRRRPEVTTGFILQLVPGSVRPRLNGGPTPIRFKHPGVDRTI